MVIKQNLPLNLSGNLIIILLILFDLVEKPSN